VLRITLKPDSGRTMKVRLEGRLTGPWVEELRKTCDGVFESGMSLALDLGELTFADRDGLLLLRALRDKKIALENLSPFLREQLRNGAR